MGDKRHLVWELLLPLIFSDIHTSILTIKIAQRIESMCGIVGCKGDARASEILLNALKSLEYRGYDSVGMAVLNKCQIFIKKDIGKISDVDKKLNFKGLEGNAGIAHSRWCTHGGVSKENSHPHTDSNGDIAVVHNGIIENFEKLKKELIEKGYVFRSETDTEVLPYLIEEAMKDGNDLKSSVIKIFQKIKGRNAIVVLNKKGDLIGARNGSPLIVGLSDSACFIASDIPAFLRHTNKVMYLDDGEMVVMGKKPIFYNMSTWKEVWKRLIEIDWNAKQAEKGEHPHFMIKEIMEQKETIKEAINQNDKEILKIAGDINNAFGTFFTACGTAGKVCLTGEYLFSQISKKHVNYIVSSEFPNYQHFLTSKTLLITVSQSGETADVMEAVETAKKKNVKIVSIVNVKGSSLDRVSDHTFLINAGPEKAVASTKATTAQMAVIMLLAYACDGRLEEGKRLLIETAAKVNDMLNPRYEDHIKSLAEKLKKVPNIYIIGRGLNYAMALESAIKIQEVSRIHAEGFAGGELKHGPLALIDKGVPCIALVANDDVKNDIINNAIEIKSRGGYIIGVSPENNKVFDYWLKVPDVGVASPIASIIPVQLLAYHLGVLRGLDPDYCVNLAKAVCVK
ncbi:MAG: glutamine--fructose-6-phosphate transaminase (isomerizing) [Candidatus Aenigmarchaeota archaeon]|nr:glutamine--fructose-6-phosphate transaminase (isomerizing) [Candidatus Aenigmarchaeota archaeon]